MWILAWKLIIIILLCRQLVRIVLTLSLSVHSFMLLHANGTNWVNISEHPMIVSGSVLKQCYLHNNMDADCKQRMYILLLFMLWSLLIIVNTFCYSPPKSYLYVQWTLNKYYFYLLIDIINISDTRTHPPSFSFLFSYSWPVNHWNQPGVTSSHLTWFTLPLVLILMLFDHYNRTNY